ncbi:MAG: (2Fe-2S) ferredoxin domain-containing protein [Clostridia bacterium]|nr:(2Fe-2S) ferredoxin domain-containing protein [Clostridia bacterium]
MEKPKYHIFVCSSARLQGAVQGVCEKKDSHEILQNIIEEVSDRGLDSEVMVSHMGCVGLCSMGPVVMIYPEQTWYGKVAPDDVEEIMDALEAGETVKRLEI